MNFDLRAHTIFLTLAGSRAYGIHNDTSDYDYRGLAIAPVSSYLGTKSKFEQCVDAKTKHVFKYYPGLVADNSDIQVYELSKFMRLAADCNPSVIEILFSEKENWILSSKFSNRLIDNKHLFLTKLAKARFSGYALSQLKRIYRHKRWLENPPTHKPTRAEFGLPEYSAIPADQLGAAETLIAQQLEKYIVAQDNLSEDIRIELQENMLRILKATWEGLQDSPFPIGHGMTYSSMEEVLEKKIMKLNFSDNFLEVLKKEKQYKNALTEWNQFCTWQETRNPARAELERKFRYDVKHGAHLVRLLRMCREILEHHEVRVRRPDAEEIVAIRNGAWSLEKLIEFAETEDKELDKVKVTSTLPYSPDYDKINDLCVSIILDFHKETSHV